MSDFDSEKKILTRQKILKTKLTTHTFTRPVLKIKSRYGFTIN